MLASTFVLFSAFTMVAAGTHSALLAQVCVVLFALPQATLLTLPVGITVAKSDESSRGRFLGALNVFAVIPQLIDTMYVGLIFPAFPSNMSSCQSRLCLLWQASDTFVVAIL